MLLMTKYKNRDFRFFFAYAYVWTLHKFHAIQVVLFIVISIPHVPFSLKHLAILCLKRLFATFVMRLEMNWYAVVENAE